MAFDRWHRDFARHIGSEDDEGGTTTSRMRLEFDEDEMWTLAALTEPFDDLILVWRRQEDTPNGDLLPW